MKKSADILRLPVISISEGKQVGTVKDLVIDAAQVRLSPWSLTMVPGIWVQK